MMENESRLVTVSLLYLGFPKATEAPKVNSSAAFEAGIHSSILRTRYVSRIDTAIDLHYSTQKHS